MNLDEIEVDLEHWEDIVETCREKFEDPLYPAIGCFQQYGVCPVGIFTPLSLELGKLYSACAGYTRISRPADYYDLPALYVDACDVIDNELVMLRPKNG